MSCSTNYHHHINHHHNFQGISGNLSIPNKELSPQKKPPSPPPRMLPVAPAWSVTFETLVVHAWTKWTVTGRGHHHLRRPRRTRGSPSSTWRGGFSVFFPKRTRGIFSVFSHLYYGRLRLVGCWKTKGLVNKNSVKYISIIPIFPPKRVSHLVQHQSLVNAETS